MELTRRISSRVTGRYNQWILRSKDGVHCTFPSDERIENLGVGLLGTMDGESRFISIVRREGNYLELNIRLHIQLSVFNAFTKQLGDETVATETQEA